MNKKGSYGDLFYILMICVVCAFVFTLGWVIMSKVNDEFQSQSSIATEGKVIMQDSSDRFVSTFDALFLTIMIVLYLGAVILAWNIDASPIFFFLSLIIFGVLVLLSAVFGNAFWTYSQNANVLTYVDDFTIIPFIMNRFVEVFVVLGFGLAGVMYAKTRQ